MKRIRIGGLTTLLVGNPIEMKRLYQRLCKASDRGNTALFPYYRDKPIKLGLHFRCVAGVLIRPDNSFVWVESDYIAQLLIDQY